MPDNSPEQYRSVGPEQQPIQNGAVFAGARRFPSAQAALDFADTHGIKTIIFPPGSYGSIDVYEGQEIIGRGVPINQEVVFDGGTSGNAVDLTNHGIVVKGVAAKTTAGAGNPYNAFEIGNNCRVICCHVVASDNNGYFCDGARSYIGSGCSAAAVDGSEVVLGQNSQDCTVDSNVQMAVINNGTSNAIGENS